MFYAFGNKHKMLKTYVVPPWKQKMRTFAGLQVSLPFFSLVGKFGCWISWNEDFWVSGVVGSVKNLGCPRIEDNLCFICSLLKNHLCRILDCKTL